MWKWKLLCSEMVLENGVVQQVGFFDALFSAFGFPVGGSPCLCDQKTGSAGRLLCEVIYTHLAAGRGT